MVILSRSQEKVTKALRELNRWKTRVLGNSESFGTVKDTGLEVGWGWGMRERGETFTQKHNSNFPKKKENGACFVTMSIL